MRRQRQHGWQWRLPALGRQLRRRPTDDPGLDHHALLEHAVGRAEREQRGPSLAPPHDRLADQDGAAAVEAEEQEQRDGVDELERGRRAREDLADDAFKIAVTMPGAIVGHNGDRIEKGAVVWEFTGEMLRDREIELMVTSRVN